MIAGSHEREELLASRGDQDGQRRDSDEVSTGLPPAENKKFYPALDGFRAVAVLLVFWGHYEGATHPTLSWGWAGVDFFFALSGFLITGILYDTLHTGYRFRNFYARRTLRIFPLYYGVLIAALVTTPIFHWLWNPAWILWFTYLGNYARFFFLHSQVAATGAVEHLVARSPFPYPLTIYTGHFWSLCIEEQFYLVWPLLIFTVKKRERLRNLCAAVFVLCLLSRIASFYLLPSSLFHADFLARVTPLRADALVIGGFAALCLRGPEAKWLHEVARPLLAVFCLCFAVFELTCIAVSPQHTIYAPDMTSLVLTTLGFSLIDVFAALLIVALVTPRGLLFRIFNIGWLRKLGQISYGFYVFHDMFHQIYGYLAHRLTHFRGPSTNLTALIGLIGSCILALLSYRYFETPFLRLKSRFTAE